MAPVKFGLFKSRSRDQQEQPSTENLLHNSNSTDQVSPGSPIPSTSKGQVENGSIDLTSLNIDSDEDVSEKATPKRRIHDERSGIEESEINYHPLRNRSIDTSTSTLNYDQVQEDIDPAYDDDASTSCDANSIQFDEMSIAPSEDMSVYCATLKKPKKMRSKEERQLRDFDMWQASNIEVMQNLLSRSGTLDEQIKWEAIATARGLCTLSDSCSCGDCARSKYLSGVSDGDGGLGAAPLFNVAVGCNLQ